MYYIIVIIVYLLLRATSHFSQNKSFGFDTTQISYKLYYNNL